MGEIINAQQNNIQTDNEKLIDLIQAKHGNDNQGQVVRKNQGTSERTEFENPKQPEKEDVQSEQPSQQPDNSSTNNPPSSTGKQDNNRVGGVSDDVQNYYDIQAIYWKVPVLSYSKIGEDGKKYYIVDQQMEIFDNQLTQIKQTLRNTYKITPKIKKHPRNSYGKLTQPYQSYLVDEVIQKIFNTQNTWIKNYNLLPKGSVIYMMYPLDQADGTKPIIYGKYILRFFGAYQYELLKDVNKQTIIPYELNKYVLMGDVVDKIGMTVKYNDITDFIKISSRLTDIEKKFPDEYQIYKTSTIQGKDHNHFIDDLQNYYTYPYKLNNPDSIISYNISKKRYILDKKNIFGNDFYIINQTNNLNTDSIINRNIIQTNYKNNFKVYQPSIRPQIKYQNDAINGLKDSFNEDGSYKYYNQPSQDLYLNTNISLQHGKVGNKKLEDWKYSFFIENLYEKCYMYVVIDYVNTNDGNIQHGSDQLQKSIFYTGGQK